MRAAPCKRTRTRVPVHYPLYYLYTTLRLLYKRTRNLIAERKCSTVTIERDGDRRTDGDEIQTLGENDTERHIVRAVEIDLLSFSYTLRISYSNSAPKLLIAYTRTIIITHTREFRFRLLQISDQNRFRFKFSGTLFFFPFRCLWRNRISHTHSWLPGLVTRGIRAFPIIIWDARVSRQIRYYGKVSTVFQRFYRYSMPILID